MPAPTLSTTQADAHRAMALWLLACCALLFAMVVVGGVTRLTHSGLSIVEWQPIIGALPPMSEAAWQETFAKYQQTPEFRQVNSHMGIVEFKGIFWWEYAHRLLGRAIGAVYLLPLLYFLARRRIDRGLAWRLAAIFVLGGLQGAMGWYMVKSGLVDNPRVSHYRLTAHLALAFLIYAAMLWQALSLMSPRPVPAADGARRGLRRFSAAITALVFVMVLSGALVAGTRAGFAYNTFPTMNGRWIPPDMFALDPWYANFFDNLTTVQFDHRLLAWVLAIVVPWFWWRSTKTALSPRARWWCNALLAVLALQLTLGITTLLYVVPVALGAAHQGGALLVFTVALIVTHELRATTGTAPAGAARARAAHGPAATA